MRRVCPPPIVWKRGAPTRQLRRAFVTGCVLASRPSVRVEPGPTDAVTCVATARRTVCTTVAAASCAAPHASFPCRRERLGSDRLKIGPATMLEQTRGAWGNSSDSLYPTHKRVFTYCIHRDAPSLPPHAPSWNPKVEAGSAPST